MPLGTLEDFKRGFAQSYSGSGFSSSHKDNVALEQQLAHIEEDNNWNQLLLRNQLQWNQMRTEADQIRQGNNDWQQQLNERSEGLDRFMESARDSNPYQ
jgi:hypothetical protein